MYMQVQLGCDFLCDWVSHIQALNSGIEVWFSLALCETIKF
jgi:hypothetical protein